MKRDRRLLNGDLVTVDVPDAQDLPPSQCFSVLTVAGVEVELNSGNADDLQHYLEISGTTLTSESTLRGGERLRYGRWGGDSRGVLAFALTVGEHEVYGFTADSDTETLAGWLGALAWTADANGPSVDPSGAADLEWSPYRTHVVAQTVLHEASPGYLLDVRRARSDGFGGKAETTGRRVAGGLLSRSTRDEREPFIVLETPDVVCYGLPTLREQVDAVTVSMSEVRITVSPS